MGLICANTGVQNKYQDGLSWKVYWRFAQHQQIKRWLDADYYFCHPYSSWERGLNENTNGLIRYYAPKGSSFEHIDQPKLKQIMSNLNTRPRKALGILRQRRFNMD